MIYNTDWRKVKQPQNRKFKIFGHLYFVIRSARWRIVFQTK